jgi:5'-3' exonuclease
MRDWTWFYPYLYAPFLSDIVKCLHTYTPPPPHPRSFPVDAMLQLFMILPPTSSTLLPSCFHRFYTDAQYQRYFDMDFDIDVYGKRKEWEGIVVLPMIDVKAFTQAYKNVMAQIPEQDQKRNRRGKTFVYTYDTRDPRQSPASPYTTICGTIPQYRTRVVTLP